MELLYIMIEGTIMYIEITRINIYWLLSITIFPLKLVPFKRSQLYHKEVRSSRSASVGWHLIIGTGHLALIYWHRPGR